MFIFFIFQKPELIQSTRLRKYLATTIQIMSLGPEEQEWVARHLGHDLTVHKEFYRLHPSAIELSKISKLLIASEQGSLHKFSGQTIADMSLEDLLKKDQNEARNVQDGAEERAGEDEPEDEPEEDEPVTKKRKKHSANEREAIYDFFKESIANLEVPGKEKCLHYVAVDASDLTWKEVKSIISSKIQCQKKKKKV
jgi:hypothetical protein